MRSHARVVVIGGGVVGCSVLYHLAKAGWRDIMLLERLELTSGSTWHAAGGFHTLNGDPNVAKLQGYTAKLYKEIEALSEQSCGVHWTGGIMLAGTPERMDFLKIAHARGRYLGMETEIISVAEAKKLLPILEEKHFIAAMYDPHEGHLDPAGTTQAYAKAARKLGAEIHRQTRVTALNPQPDGGWEVVTEKGTVKAEHVVNCGGLWAREVGRMVGLELPVLAMEHHYIVSEEMPEVVAINQATGKEVLHVIDFEAEVYLRQEGKGMLLGTYERKGVPWSEQSTPWEFGPELLQEDLDRIAPSLEMGFKHFPAIGRAGIKRVVNGPFTFTPDGNPLVGPVRGLSNYWLACGVMAGFSQGGGVGLALANWMTEGDPGFDVWGMDIARYGDWTTMAYTNAKVRENYSRRFRIRFPNEELPAARPLRTVPVHDRVVEANAVLGAYYGLEHPLWYSPKGDKAEETVTYRRSNAFAHVGAECRGVRDRVGMAEISTYGRFDVSGRDAAAFLDRVLANRLPEEGRLALAPMLNEKGRLIGDFTVGRLARDRFFVIGTQAAETYYQRWFDRQRGALSVEVRSLLSALNGITIAGPRSREVLARLVRDDVSNAAFPFLSIRRMSVGMVPCTVSRVSFTGELGYELWCAPDMQRALWDAIMEAGGDLGIGLFGAQALNSMRLEKGFGSWAREYRPIYGAEEARLGRFVRLEKGAFIGRDAAAAERKAGGERRLVLLAVDSPDADAFGDEPIWHDGKVVGWVTSGGYGHTVSKSLALGYVPRAVAEAASGLAIEMLGERRPAKILKDPPHDPKGTRMRS
ncbi:MAG: FAD-dependent oxidoreductase [Alphaproteobacteria bacterium]|nr:FAD-dependent oxidoreductase [Alphaproteobacteria bacterium]